MTSVAIPNLRIDEHLSIGAVSLYTIRAAARSGSRRIESAGRMKYRERRDPTISSIQVRNRSRQPALVPGGFILQGGRQCRAVVRTTLALGGSAGDLGVVCVERGRWSGGRAELTPFGMAGAAIRSSLIWGREDIQYLAWTCVDRLLSKLDVSSPTRSLCDAHQQLRNHPRTRAFGAAVPMGDDCVGYAMYLGPRLCSMELFQTPSLWSRWGPPIFEGLAVECAAGTSGPGDDTESSPCPADLIDLIDVRSWKGADAGGSGVRLTWSETGLAGSALVYQDGLLHMHICGTALSLKNDRMGRCAQTVPSLGTRRSGQSVPGRRCGNCGFLYGVLKDEAGLVWCNHCGAKN